MPAFSLTFPDGSVRDYDAATTGAELAESISKSLAKKAVAYALDGTLRDLSDPIAKSGKVEIVTRDDHRALELIRHDAAHVLAEAVQELWPGAQVTIGPVIENGFYYDFARNEPFTPEDFPAIEAKMREIIARDKPFTKEVWSRDKAKQRDHRRLGREMDLFHFQEEGPGVVFWHPKGWMVFQELISYMRRRLKGTYQEVNAPQILDKALWETSGHWGWYSDNMFAVKSASAFLRPSDPEADQRLFALKPMNCPGHVQIFKHGLKSYRDLPLRLAEFGNVHRYEPSGALHGLM